MNEIENIQKHYIRFVLNDYTLNYEALRNKSNKCTMDRLRVLALEVFRSVNKLNAVYMQSLFEKYINFKRYIDDLKVSIRNSVTFGDKRVRLLGYHIWNMLPAQSKKETLYGKFKTQINNWFGPKCNCSACKHVGNQPATLLHHDFNQIKQIKNLRLDPFLKTALCFYFHLFLLFLYIIYTLAFICDCFYVFV